MDQTKYINTYIDVAMSTINESSSTILQLKTQNRIASDVISEKDRFIAALAEEKDRAIAALSTEVENLRKIVESDDSKFDKQKYEQLVQEHNGALTKLSHMDALIKQVGEMKQDIISKENQIKTLSDAAGPKDAEIASLNIAIGEKEARLNALQSGINNRDAEIIGLRNAVTEKDGSINSLQNEIRDRDTKLGATQNDLQEKVATIDQLRTEINNINTTINDLQTTLASKEIEVEELKANVKEVTNVVALNAAAAKSGKKVDRKPINFPMVENSKDSSNDF